MAKILEPIQYRSLKKISASVSLALLFGLVYFLSLFVNSTTSPAWYILTSIGRPLCPKEPPRLKGLTAPLLSVLSDEQIVAANPEVRPGGHFEPNECQARSRVAIIVAYRDRHKHLQMFLSNLHPVLQRQQLDYTIFIVEQAGKDIFNKGILFNAGYVEAGLFGSFQCYVFHDVDIYPENDRNSYSCRDTPTQLAAAMNKYSYRPLQKIFSIYFGAAVSFSAKHFVDVNGYPNIYWGWGGEDDDMGHRVQQKFGNITFTALAVGRYTMAPHGADEGNPINAQRFKLVATGSKRFLTDGLSSLNYTLIAKERRTLYTWLLVDVGKPATVSKQNCTQRARKKMIGNAS